MKKTGLIVTIIICLIIFFATLTGGIILTFRTIGWNALMDSSQFRDKVNELADSLQDLDLDIGLQEAFTIDETKTIDLTGIEIIRISAVAEVVTLNTGGQLVEARLKGTYRSHSQQISWVVEKQGKELLIHAKYPALSIMASSLAMTVQIPAGFSGDVQVNTVSGDCELPDSTDRAWSLFKFSSTSGDLAISRASFPDLTLSTVSGQIDIEQCVSRISCNTISGKVAINWADFAESSIETVSGQVSLVLPVSADCHLEFKTVSGDFQNKDLPLQMTVQQKRRLEGLMNQGGQDLSVETVSGSLTMKQS